MQIKMMKKEKWECNY